MVSFYSSIIFIGIILIVVSFIWILLDKKNVFDTELRIDEKKAELIRIISDAEMMVEELNKFSDYVVTKIDEKNIEMDKRFTEAEILVQTIRNETLSFYDLQNRAIENGYAPIKHSTIGVNATKRSEALIGKNDKNVVDSTKNKKGASVSKVKEKVIPINSKHNEVINLAKKGFNETDIARKLNMGKGEIQLILGVNR